MDNPRVLVIDDEIGICQAVKRALMPTGYIVDTMTSGEGGLKKIQADGYDLVLLDIMMPGVSGIDLIASIHEHDPEIVCVIITGYATVELAVRAIKHGAYDFLTKPFSVDDLLLAVSQGLERRRLSLEARRAEAAEAEARQLAIDKKHLEELDRAKQQFINLVTHELKAPISAIQEYLFLIRDGYVSPDKQVDLIQKCVVRADEEIDLVNDLLGLGKIQANEEKARRATASLIETLQEVVKGLDEQIKRKQLTLNISVSDPIPPVKGLTEQLKSMWENLIGNAVKYTPENGSIIIHLFAKKGQINCDVTDTGIGIPLEDQDRLFGEFFRAGNVKELGIPGTGLGMVIVKRVVENAGGTIAVKSEVGHGTTITFTIPVAGGNEP
jgi:signal transduction histidine kinase